MAVIAAVWVPLNLASIETIAWLWVAIGFGTFAVGFGPGANSSLGMRIGSWFRDIGAGGRALAILLFAIGFWITISTIDVSSSTVSSLAGGGMLAIAVFVPLYILYAGEVDGWRST